MTALGIASLKDVIATLFLWIAANSGYAYPSQLPEVSFMEESHLSALACDGPCTVMALFRQGEGIYLHERFARKMGVCGLSILAHELVHVLQEEHGAFNHLDPRRRWLMRENEAYALQMRYIAQYPPRYRPRDVSYGFSIAAANSSRAPLYVAARGCRVSEHGFR